MHGFAVAEPPSDYLGRVAYRTQDNHERLVMVPGGEKV